MQQGSGEPRSTQQDAGTAMQPAVRGGSVPPECPPGTSSGGSEPGIQAPSVPAGSAVSGQAPGSTSDAEVFVLDTMVDLEAGASSLEQAAPRPVARSWSQDLRPHDTQLDAWALVPWAARAFGELLAVVDCCGGANASGSGSRGGSSNYAAACASTLTYGRLADRCAALAHGLWHAHGLRPGARKSDVA